MLRIDRGNSVSPWSIIKVVHTHRSGGCPERMQPFLILVQTLFSMFSTIPTRFPTVDLRPLSVLDRRSTPIAARRFCCISSGLRTWNWQVVIVRSGEDGSAHSTHKETGAGYRCYGSGEGSPIRKRRAKPVATMTNIRRWQTFCSGGSCRTRKLSRALAEKD